MWPILFFCCFSIFLNAAEVQAKVALCGICKNVEKALPYSIASLEKLGRYFDDYHIFIYENNSQDHTRTLLKNWAKKNPKVWLKSERMRHHTLLRECVNVNIISQKVSREEQIARARNIVLNQVMSGKYDDYTYVCWLDMDFMHLLPFEAIIETILSDREWDAVFANGTGSPNGDMYDHYALRTTVEPIGPELRMDWWNRKHSLRLTDSDDWYPVYSAFGGFGIYKREALRGCHYSGIVTRDMDIVTATIIEENKDSQRIKQYLASIEQLEYVHILSTPIPGLPYYPQRNWGFKINPEGKVVWRMSLDCLQYPIVCEHVPLHASMITNGHDKLFINPKIKMILHP